MKLGLIRSLSRWELKKVDRVFLEGKYEKYTGHLTICELHVPYTYWDKINEMVEKDKKIKGHKTLFLAGDSLNLDLFSRFYQTSADKSKPSDEIRTLVEFMKYAERVYDKIIFMISNHENRLTKVILQYVMHKEIAQEVINLMSNYYDIFNDNKLKKIEVVDHYMFQIGNVIVAHIEHNSSTPGATRRFIIQYLIPRIAKSWDICFEAHTHCQGGDNIEGKSVIETGCMAGSLDYWVNGKIQGRGKHSTIGYATCDMVNGIADSNDCHYVKSRWQECI